LFHVAATVAEANHFFFSGDDFEPPGNGFGNDEVEAVRADVQCGYEVTHCF
jgi:hypothetical protein